MLPDIRMEDFPLIQIILKEKNYFKFQNTEVFLVHICKNFSGNS